MVAYSFKQRFVQPIRVGLSRVSLSFDCPPKRQTIRAIGKRRHARPGEELQLYFAQRSPECELIGKARCIAVENIIIWPGNMTIMLAGKIQTARQIQSFVRQDGFEGVEDMQLFWKENHPGIDKFEGVMIRWESL
jgi:hypothetical protein